MPETVTGHGPVEPLGWQGDDLDFELTHSRAVGPNYEWNAYYRDALVRRGWARTKVGAHLAMAFVWLGWKWSRRRAH